MNIVPFVPIERESTMAKGVLPVLSEVKRTFKKLSASGEYTISKQATLAILRNHLKAFKVKFPDIASDCCALECVIDAKQSTS